jgi:hypothetical protein
LPTLLGIFFGAAFTLISAYALGAILLRPLPAPPEIALGVGAVVLSFLIFVALLLNLGYWYVFLAVGLPAIVWLRWLRRASPAEPAMPKGWPRAAAILIFGAYGVWYFVNALAPEVVADGMTYHLGLPFEYIRLGGFPDRISFYEMAPQGMEMLYTAAFAFGRHSAAKLVELGFFLATLPLIFRIGRRLGLSDVGSLAAATIYFCAPVAGITGSSSYNDAAGVFFALGAFYLLLDWRETSDWRYLPAAGALAGFCYAIKFPGVFAVAGAALYPLALRRFRAAALVAACAVLVMLPWLARDLALTGNPVAPLMNAAFPNPYFHVATEREITSGLRSLGEVSPAEAPWELAFGDRLTGTFGPLLFALPLGLLALRRPAGRVCLAAAALLAAPWFFNTGARFLMPGVAFAALALGMALPRPAAWAAVAIQAALCWPHVIDTWETRFAFRLHEFPLRAALRLTPEAEYISIREQQYAVAKMIEKLTPPNARILALDSVVNAYLDREATVFWQSAEGDRMLDALRMAAMSQRVGMYEWKARWPAADVGALRLRLAAGCPGEWQIGDIRMFSGEDQVFNSPQWELWAWPNPWEVPLAFDGNLATRWRTWEPARAGMLLEADFDHPQRLSAVALMTLESPGGAPIEVFGQRTDGRWRLLANGPDSVLSQPRDLRLDAARVLRSAGFRWILTATGSHGNAPIGNVLVEQAPQWGMEVAGNAGRFILFHVK